MTDWKGGKCPVPRMAKVRVALRGDPTFFGPSVRAGSLAWGHDNQAGDIVAYEIKAPGSPIDSKEEEKGMIRWEGGLPPVGKEQEVRYILRNGASYSWRAGSLSWFHSGTSSDIVAYKVVKKKGQPEKVRVFKTGATRSSEIGRYDPEGVLSPIAIERYCEYMNKNRVQPDGMTRDSDNWQKGIPQAAYVKSMWRHFLHLWTRHRGYAVRDPKAAVGVEEDLCALLFNVQGMLHEVVKARLK